MEQGLKSASKQDAALPGLAAIGEFIQKMNTDEQSGEVLKGAAGLIGDIGQAYGPRCKQLFQQPYIMEILQRAIQDEDSQTNGTWSQQVCPCPYRGRIVTWSYHVPYTVS